MRKGVVLLAVLICAAPVLADPANDAEAVGAAANRFYAAYATFHPSDGIPDAGGRARYAPVVSDRLAKLIADAARAGDRFNAHNKGSPPLLEGDLFTSMFEGATSWKVGACSGDAKAAHCAVTLHHDQAGQKPAIWTDTLFLVAGANGWRVDDVGYGGGFAFGNTGKLSDTLKSALAAAP